MMRDMRAAVGLAAFFLCAALALAQRAPGAPQLGSEVTSGGGGGGGDITAVGDCTTGSCLTSGTTTMAGNAVFQGTNATQGVHSFGSAAQTTISAAGAITSSAAATFTSATATDVQGGLQNTGSTACFGSITGAVCVPDANGVAVSPASGDAVIRLSNPVNTGSSVVYVYAQSSLVGGLRWSDVGSSDADYADKLSVASTNKLMAAIQSADISAGSAMYEWRDNAAGSGVRLAYIDGAGNLYTASGGTRTRGSITLAAGTGTATVSTGAVCVCTDRTAVAAVQCSVSGTTLTANGTGTDVISYLCIGDA